MGICKGNVWERNIQGNFPASVYSIGQCCAKNSATLWFAECVQYSVWTKSISLSVDLVLVEFSATSIMC